MGEALSLPRPLWMFHFQTIVDFRDVLQPAGNGLGDLLEVIRGDASRQRRHARGAPAWHAAEFVVAAPLKMILDFVAQATASRAAGERSTHVVEVVEKGPTTTEKHADATSSHFDAGGHFDQPHAPSTGVAFAERIGPAPAVDALGIGFALDDNKARLLPRASGECGSLQVPEVGTGFGF